MKLALPYTCLLNTNFSFFVFIISGGTFRRVLIGDTNEVLQEEIDVTFEDVKGVDEAKQELQEIVEFL